MQTIKNLEWNDFIKFATSKQIEKIKQEIEKIIRYADTYDISGPFDAIINCEVEINENDNFSIKRIIDFYHPDKVISEQNFSIKMKVLINRYINILLEPKNMDYVQSEALECLEHDNIKYTYSAPKIKKRKGVYDVEYCGTLRQYADGRVEVWDAAITYL